MARTSSMARCNSAGVSPASASSSSSRRGPVAMTRAISRRLRPGVPRLRARWLASSLSSVISMTASARSRASPRCAWRRKAPTMTFSRMVMSSNVAGIWKVRPMPRRACASAGALVTSLPSNAMRPADGTMSPAMQLKKVDLPAPLGPISPTISPCVTCRSAPATAWKVPKFFETLSALSSIADLRTLGGERRDEAMPQYQQAAGLEAGDEYDDAAVDDVREARAAAAEPGIGRGLQRHQDHRSEKRPEQGARAAERGSDHQLHRDEDAEPALGIDEAGLERVERAGERGERGAQHQCVDLVASYRHAEAARRALARAYGAQVVPEAAALQLPDDEQQHRQHGEEDVIVGNRAAKAQIPPAARGRGPLQSDGGADEIPVADDDAHQLRHRDRRHAEIVSQQPQGRKPDQNGDDEADGDAGRYADER